MTETIQKVWHDIAIAFDEKFKNAIKISLLKHYKRCLIMAHGDLDGIASAGLMNLIFRHNCDVIETCFYRSHFIKVFNPKATKPENKGIITDKYDLIIVVDLAINNRDYKSVETFIKSIENKLLWIDHHYTNKTIPICIIKSHNSCVALIQQLFPNAIYPRKVLELIEHAHRTDMGDGDNIFNHSLKVNLRSDEARYEILRYMTSIVGGELERISLERIKLKDIRHLLLVKNSDEALANWTTFYKNVAVIDAIDHRDKTTNSTYMFFECYKKAKCVIYKYLSTHRDRGGEEYMKIARSNDCNIHLPQLFGLPSGAKYRITKKNARRPTPEENKDRPPPTERDINAPKNHNRWCYTLKADESGYYIRYYNGMIKYTDAELVHILDRAIAKLK